MLPKSVNQLVIERNQLFNFSEILVLLEKPKIFIMGKHMEISNEAKEMGIKEDKLYLVMLLEEQNSLFNWQSHKFLQLLNNP